MNQFLSTLAVTYEIQKLDVVMFFTGGRGEQKALWW